MSSIQFDDATADEATKHEVLSRFPEPRRRTRQVTGDDRHHTDADSIRRYFGIPAWDASKFDEYDDVVPNCWEHGWDTPPNRSSGGTDFLATGKPDSGKSTLACYVATRMAEINDEKVVWRASPSRSEWMPLAPWVTLCLPSNVPVSARLEPKDPNDRPVVLDVDELEAIVRSVERYDDPVDLNRRVLEPGQIHVVYPDPQLRGCQAIYERDSEKQYDEPQGDRSELFSDADPANHWWFAWVLARVNHGPHHWTTWICDEIGDLAPQSASKDESGTLQKIELFRDTWVDARKFGLTIGLFGHSEVDIHAHIRRKIRWRIQMPRSANPTTSSALIGFDNVEMETDMTTHYDVGQALMYTEQHFDPFKWKDMPAPNGYKLKVEVGR